MGEPATQEQRDLADGARPLTFGERAVGLTFNPSNNGAVDAIKRGAADYITTLNHYREDTDDPEVKRMLSVAITEAQTSQMWGVKGVTWNLGAK